MKLIVLLLITSLLLTGPSVLAQDTEDSLLKQMTEQGVPLTNGFDTRLLDGTNEPGIDNETYLGIKNFWNVDIIDNFFANIGQVIGRWLAEAVNGWLAETVRFLTTYLRTFVLNPNILAGLNQGQSGNGDTSQTDDISPFLERGINIMYSIALDLLLILFILSIWRYWTGAAWNGGGSITSAVGRLIFTISIILAWRTIYSLEIQISNEMIQAIFFQSADQIQSLDASMGNLVKAGLVANSGLVARSLGNVSDPNAVSSVGGSVGGLVSFVGLIIFLVFAIVLIAQLLIILILKAIQTALLAVQYMFAPFFLVFFATPDTASISSGYIRSFIEVSLWTFIWVGLLKIMTILLFASMSPWGKIVLAIAVLQLMIQAPSFLAGAKLSPLSSVVSGGLMNKNALGQVFTLAQTMASKAGGLLGGSKTEGLNSMALSSVPGSNLGGAKLSWSNPLNNDGAFSKPSGLSNSLEPSAIMSKRAIETSAGSRFLNRTPPLMRRAGREAISCAQSLSMRGGIASAHMDSGAKSLLTDMSDYAEVKQGVQTEFTVGAPVSKDSFDDAIKMQASIDAEPLAVSETGEVGPNLASGSQLLETNAFDTALSVPFGSAPHHIAPNCAYEVSSDLPYLNWQRSSEPLTFYKKMPGSNNLSPSTLTRPLLKVGACVNAIALARCLNPDPTTDVSILDRSLGESSIFGQLDDPQSVGEELLHNDAVENSVAENNAAENGAAENGKVNSIGGSDRKNTGRNFVGAKPASLVSAEAFKNNNRSVLSTDKKQAMRFSGVFLTTPENKLPQGSADGDVWPKFETKSFERSEAQINGASFPTSFQQQHVFALRSQAPNDLFDKPRAKDYIVSDLRSAGFEEHHLQNPQIVATMLDLYDENPALLYGGADPLILQSAALAAQMLPSEYFEQEKVLQTYEKLRILNRA